MFRIAPGPVNSEEVHADREITDLDFGSATSSVVELHEPLLDADLYFFFWVFQKI